MENASKAILMAGGMLLAILILSLIIYAWSIFSKYQSSKDDLADIEDTAKFNEQFTNYDRDDVMGYELLSLINQVIDYNETKSTDTINGNNEQYNYVTLTINMGEDNNRKKLTYNDETQLFLVDEYTAVKLTGIDTTTNKRVSFKDNILSPINDYIGTYVGSDEAASGIAKSMSSIFLTQDEIDAKAYALQRKNGEKTVDEYKTIVENEMKTKYNSYVLDSYKVTDIDDIKLQKDKKKTKNSETTTGKGKGDLYTRACAYYEWMQFKKGIFTCSSLGYDSNTNRVNAITFDFTGKIK